MRVGSLLAFVPLMLASGCGGADGPASVQGAIAGRSFASAFASSGHAYREAVIDISDASGYCHALASGADETGSQILALDLQEGDLVAGTTTFPSHTGDYTIFDANTPNPSGQLASGSYVYLGTSFETSTVTDASSGTVTLTDIDGSHYAGSFDITFATGDALRGTFDAAACSAIKTPEQ